MSKNGSGIYKGTRGQRASSVLKPSAQKVAVTSWARTQAEQLKAISKRQRDKFRTASIVVDEETGNVFFGRNGGIDRSGARKNPVLFGANGKPGILPSKSQNAYPTPWNCAETDAINSALNAGAKLENLHLYTIGTGVKDFGRAKKSCINCKQAYKGRIKRNNTGWIE